MDALQKQIESLTLQIELEESNYRHAIEKNEDYYTLRRMREQIRQLKDKLTSCRQRKEQWDNGWVEGLKTA